MQVVTRRGPGDSRPIRLWPVCRSGPRPARGPSRMAIATARFSRTDWRGTGPEQQIVQSDNLVPIGALRCGGTRMHGRDCGLNSIDSDLAGRQDLLHQGPALSNHRPIPLRPILLFEQYDVARVGRPRRARATLATASEPKGRLPQGRAEPHSSRPSRIASPDRSARVSESPRRCRVPLVKDEVDDREHRVQPLGKIAARRHLERNARVADLRLAASHDALGNRRRCRQESAGDLLGRQPAHFVQREGNLRLRRQRRVTTGKMSRNWSSPNSSSPAGWP